MSKDKKKQWTIELIEVSSIILAVIGWVDLRVGLRMGGRSI